jgi:putative ABC transport system ATP-binding protein
MTESDEDWALRSEGVVLERERQRFARVPDLRLERGRAVALTGVSGSGKTTALLALAAIRRPSEGTVIVHGCDIWSLPSSERDRFRGQHIGLVFQSFHLVDAVSVLENLKLASLYAGHRPDRERARMLMDRLGILDLANRRADRLSQGQAQRVAVARALINGPAVVLADEPTSALDDANAAAMIGLLRDAVERQGAALVVTTHDRRVLDAMDFVLPMGLP